MSVYVDIEKKLGSFRLTVQLEADKETLAILGASGCGKSVTLKCIAGIMKPDKGKILLDGVTLFDSEKKIDLPPQQRHIGLMLQNYALFPNMTVEENICAGAKGVHGKNTRKDAVSAIMKRFGLTELAKHLPRQLSGGQQQRVALARLLVSEPKILLLDEPFSALDSHLRFRMEQEVRQVIRQFGKTVLLVSHDRDEVFRMADRIAIMENGTVQRVGTKREVFADPQTRKSAEMTGCKNISAITPLKNGKILATDWGISLDVDRLPPLTTAVGIRMHDICLGPGRNSHRCRVMEEIENPFSYTIMLQPLSSNGGSGIGWELDKDKWQAIRAEEVEICLPPEALLPLRD